MLTRIKFGCIAILFACIGIWLMRERLSEPDLNKIEIVWPMGSLNQFHPKEVSLYYTAAEDDQLSERQVVRQPYHSEKMIFRMPQALTSFRFDVGFEDAVPDQIEKTEVSVRINGSDQRLSETGIFRLGNPHYASIYCPNLIYRETYRANARLRVVLQVIIGVVLSGLCYFALTLCRGWLMMSFTIFKRHMVSSLEESKQVRRNFGIDFIKVVSAFLVIVLHISCGFVGNVMRDEGQAFFVFLNGLTRIAVPLFIMCSGATLLGRDEPIGDFLGKRIHKLLIPFVFWALTYEFHPVRSTTTFNVADFLLSLLNGRVMFHLWFVYMIIGVYFMIPLLRPMVVKMKSCHGWYLLIASIVVSLLDLGSRRFGLDISHFFLSSFFCVYVMYLILGYVLAQGVVCFSSRLKIPVALLTLLAVSVVNGILSLKEIRATNIAHSYWWEHGTILVLIGSISAFVLGIELQKYLASRLWLRKILAEISGATYGIYLMHMWFVTYIAQLLYGGWFWVNHKVSCVVVCMLLVGIGCVVVSVVIRRIPFLRRLV